MKSLWSILGYGTTFFVKPAILIVAVTYPTTILATVTTVGTVIGCGPMAVGVTCFFGFLLL